MITLYPYQQTFIHNLAVALTKHKHVVGFAPCGFGKSYCIAELARRAVVRKRKTLILSHRLILLRQNNGSLADFGHTMITINDENDSMGTTGMLYCATLQTIQSRLRRDGFACFLSTFELILIDECHTQNANFLFETGIIDETMVIGFSGSPRRTGNQRQLGMDYETIVLSETVNSLIGHKKLVPCRYFEVPFDVSGLKVDPLSGDYTAKSQYIKFDSPEVYGGVIDNYRRYGESRPFVCFCSNIAHVIKTTREFCMSGIQVRFVVSNLNRPNKPASEGAEYERYLDHLEAYTLLQENRHLRLDQTEVNAAFDSGEIAGVVSINVMTTGWDYKPLSCLILNRATTSLPLLIQMFGRVQRPFAGKSDAIILDFGENVKRLGDAETDREWSLWHETSDSVGIPAEKECAGVDKNGRKGCGRLILASYSICPFCGFRFATAEEIREVELTERLADAPEKWKEMTAQQLSDLAELRGWKRAWVFRQLSLRTESEFRVGMRALGYDNKFIYRQQKMLYKS